MNFLFLSSLSVVSMLIVGCGSSENSFDGTTTCSVSDVSGGMITTAEVNTTGSILFDCEKEEYRIGGSGQMAVINRIYVSSGQVSFQNGSSWQGSESFDESSGIYNAKGAHTALGNYDCNAGLESKLPTQIDNSDKDKIAEVIGDYNTTSSGESCPPDWVTDGTLEEGAVSTTLTENIKIIDSSNATHTISSSAVILEVSN